MNRLRIFGMAAAVFLWTGGLVVSAREPTPALNDPVFLPPNFGVPDGGSSLWLLALALVGTASLRRFLRQKS